MKFGALPRDHQLRKIVEDLMHVQQEIEASVPRAPEGSRESGT